MIELFLAVAALLKVSLSNRAAHHMARVYVGTTTLRAFCQLVKVKEYLLDCTSTDAAVLTMETLGCHCIKLSIPFTFDIEEGHKEKAVN